MMRTPDDLAEDRIFIVKADGEKLGPYQAAVNSQKGLVEVFSKELDAKVGDTLLRLTTPGRDEIYTIEDVHYNSVTHDVFAPWELEVKRQGAPEKARGSGVANTFNINSQNVQIGDYNIQNVMGMLQGLEVEIDKADAPAEQKAEARKRLQEFLTHPLTVTITGGLAAAFAAKLAK